MSRCLLAVLVLGACAVPDKQPAQGDGGLDAPPGDGPPGDAPETTITSSPAEFSNAGTASFAFSSNLPDATFRCSIDGDTPVVCASPFSRTLGDGAHSFSVRAVDPGGNADDTPAEHLWSIDTLIPTTTLLEAPPAADNSTRVTFRFRSNEPNAVFECSLDNGSYAACESGAEVGPIGDGPHAFAVRARDRADNVDASPAIHAWTVDTSTPDTQLISGPVGATSSTTATFAFVSPDAGAGATFQCALDGAAFATCGSPQVLSGLTMGEHTFAVRVLDAVGNFDPTPATRTWTVDLTPPETTIADGPTGTVATASAAFTFTSNELEVAFACSLDGAAFTACTSPANYLALGQGSHTFAVRATDAAGHPDPTPATRTWTVDTVAPDIVFTDGPAAGSTSGPRVVFGFTISEGDVSCSLDTVALASCASPLAFNLPAGSHTLAITSTDGAGNATTVTRTWLVVCAAADAAGAAGQLHLDAFTQALANAVAGGIEASLGADLTVEVADPVAVGGRFGAGLGFQAAETDHVAWPVALGATSAMTLELWARPEASAGARDLVGSGDGRVVVRTTAVGASSVQISLTVVDGNGAPITVSSAPVAASGWHHVVAAWQAPTLRLWVDGARTEIGGLVLGPAVTLDALRLGGEGGTAYDGFLDEVWVSQTATVTDELVLGRFCPL